VFAGNEFLEQQCLRGNLGRVFAQPQGFVFVAQGQQARSSNSHYGSNAVIPAWMPESSAMDGDMSCVKCLKKA